MNKKLEDLTLEELQNEYKGLQHKYQVLDAAYNDLLLNLGDSMKSHQENILYIRGLEQTITALSKKMEDNIAPAEDVNEGEIF